ncbi:signal peptidase I [Sphingobacterium haloxyli]|uniref:Signal peptidase I n=1 Tax=Sphingobacterium haloxyli TaxID=2100533 RepID=A0A2S9J043_9SPHI|nr:signal peptidase I [Sphingobacterium haloxyli]PRD46110.1 signal peptidase I [Sphingobacterium haloxyli]
MIDSKKHNIHDTERTINNSRYVGRIVLAIVITMLVVIVLRILVFASFRIPSFSMEPTLFAGDFILVNKLIPGPRIDFLGSSKDGRPFRLTGYRAIKRNQVLVFNDPYYKSKQIVKNWNVYHVKRCVGIPGDTLVIHNGAYYLNGQLNKFGDGIYANDGQRALYMSPRAYAPKMFKALGWTIDDFGPIYIPRKGDIITLDTANINLYRRIIEYETGKKLIEIDGGIFSLDGHASRQYQFDRNYYFMVGDNAMDSKDSRYWGLLPEDHIVGKVDYIWKSKDLGTNTYRFERFFKPVE